jgi:hypothetical protein
VITVIVKIGYSREDQYAFRRLSLVGCGKHVSERTEEKKNKTGTIRIT